MNIREAIKIHNELCDKEEIIKYCDALHIIYEKMRECKPKKEYYKSSKTKDYYIELPYRGLTFNNGKVVYEKHGYSCSYTFKNKSKYSGGNYCLSKCNKNREYITNLIEREILKDNSKEEELNEH